jgi:8-oxo-dGTP pyrophosphatase MutT (NUDIX family)/transcriptional regulator with XRE-family HTH domain
VEGIRERRRLSQDDLARLAGRLGRPMTRQIVSKTEAGDRRIDVDDLVALAIALDTTPNRLLLSADASNDESMELTSEVTVSTLDAWRWATGDEPLPAGTAPPDRQMLVRDDRERSFTRENQPHNRPEPYFRNVGHDVRDYPHIVRMGAVVIEDARKRGMQIGALVRLMEYLDTQRRLGNLDDLLVAISGTGNGDAQRQEQPVVAAIVTSPLGVLVGQRRDGKPPWTFIAGEQDAVKDELPRDTAIREVKEETGLRVEAGDVIGERTHPKTGRRMIYIAATPTHGTEVFVGDEEELTEVRWVTLTEADELLPGMYEPVRAHLARELGEADR